MSDGMAFILALTIAAVGCMIYTAIYRLIEAIEDKDIIKINNFGITRTESDDGFSVRFDGEKWIRTEWKKDE